MSTQGRRLKEIRHSLKLTQEEMGLKLNMSKHYFSKAETDKIVLNNKQLVSLCINFKVNINYLLAGEGGLFTDNLTSQEQEKSFAEKVEEVLRSKGIL